MWSRNDFEDGLDIYKTGSSASSPGWVPGCESAWHGSTSISGSNRARRHSAASDSADTGIGTSCSDSVEDHSSSSGTLSFQPLRSQGFIPTAHVMPSPSSTKLSVTQSVPGSPWNSSQLSSPVSSPLDMKDPRPVRRWSSLTRLTGQEKSGRNSCQPDAHGSLDRSLLHGRTDASPLKPSTLDLSYSALPESRASLATPRAHSLGHQAVGGSPIQPSIRTQMWLSEQMEFRPEGMSTWLSEQQQRDRMRQDAELSQVR
ncbi:Centrosomal protein of 85 kDa-like [Bagarius yarrelli]|uniref:Centrosomal protein of 85 kDa-like n=1 Tax=Bagarius yarrelli TaxID=175774 RepID=A0A556UYB3_BAGYA|nr:Centrosomal protein of 85 kDa-like [Bagarius yarrelli]